MSQRVRRLRGYQLSYRGDRLRGSQGVQEMYGFSYVATCASIYVFMNVFLIFGMVSVVISRVSSTIKRFEISCSSQFE